MAPRSKSEEYKILSDIAKEEDFPLDSLIAMYMVESSGDSQAVNKLGYTGGFQFGKVTGEEFGLVGEGFDHRKDLGKSAKAAIKMVKKNLKDEVQFKSGKQISLKEYYRSLEIPDDLAGYMTHQQGRGGFIDIITGAKSGKITANTRKNILSNLGTSTAKKAEKMGDKELVNTYLDFWKSTWQTKGIEAAKGWTEDAQVNTNIAFAARDEIKKNASNIAFENMERVNKKSDVNIASYKETEAEKVQREMEELMSRGRAKSISKRERK
tara:strand:+ start:58 stop:858 length:801 start_codon:yes stop_codon:yes gene_type:complete